jgi:hypothetical protein
MGIYPTSITYGLGQQYAFSQDQGSTYLGSSYGNPLTFTPRLSVTNGVSIGAWHGAMPKHRKV